MDKRAMEFALAALPLVIGLVLVLAGHAQEGANLLSLGAGIVSGLALRRNGSGSGGSSLPPPSLVPLGIAVGAFTLAVLVTGCGSSPPPSACALARAMRAPCAFASTYAANCPDAGQ